MALEVLISIGGKVAQLLVEPIGRRLMFIVHPSRNIPKLKRKIEELEAQKKGVQESIDPATRNGQVIRPDVKLWTERVDKLIEETKLIAQGGSHENSKCLRFIPNPATRYHKGKWAEEKTIELDELLATGGNFTNTNIANPAPLLGIEALPSTGSVDTNYAATRSAREQVMEALRDENTNFIAIHGIGGVGKTTLVTDIGKKVKEDKLFDEVVMAVVSQNQDIKKIQSEIGGWLGFNLTDESVMIRATKLCERIKNAGRILVILDDVWDKLDLQTVGIPSDKDHHGCKIIITTRRKQVCGAMGPVGMRKTITLNVLSEEDSWDLFKLKAGSENVDSPKLNAIAKEVWRECGHLPLALVTVGSAMSGKEDPEDWREAAKQLKDAAPQDIEGVEQHVYKSIKLSYDYLKDETAKNLVLLCTLFPEDHNICVEDMVRYGWGLRMFRGGSIDTVLGARRRMKAMINNLKEASLLLPGDEEGGEFVKMHDVVRDVAIRIGSGKYICVAGSRSLENWPSMMRETMDKYEGISLMGKEIDNYPSVWDFPKLKILLLVGEGIVSLSCERYLSKLKELNVVHVSPPYVGRNWYVDRVVLGAGHYAVSHLQTCLRTLILRYVDGPDIAAIGKITALEILDLKGSRFHDEPNASCIRALTNLRVLDLEETEFPNLVADTSLLSPDLTCLEELYMGGRTLSWDDMKIARNLPRLKVLQASTPAIETVPPGLVFPHQLETFCITLGCKWRDPFKGWDKHTPSLILLLILKESAYVWRGSLTTLLTKCRYLRMEICSKMESIFPDLSARAEDVKLLTHLEILDCNEFRSIINASTSTAADADAGHQQLLLSSLEYLWLYELPRLEYIFKHSSSVSLCNLKEVTVETCGILKKYVFQPAVAQSLVQLEELRVLDCRQLGEIVGDDDQDEDGEEEKTNDDNNVRRLEFPNLKRVVLANLAELRGFCCCSRGDLLFDWPSLEYLYVTLCPKMTTWTSSSSSAGTLSTPKLKSVSSSSKRTWNRKSGGRIIEEMIPQGMDLNQFLLLKNAHGGGGAEGLQTTSDSDS